MRSKTLFGREPVAWLGLVEAVLTLLMAFALGVSKDTYGPILALVTAAFGVYTAWATRDTALGAIVGLVKSSLVVAAVYGLTLSDQQTGALVMVTTVVVTFFQRTQTSPEVALGGSLSPSPQAVVVTDAAGKPLDPVPLPDPNLGSTDSNGVFTPAEPNDQAGVSGRVP